METNDMFKENTITIAFSNNEFKLPIKNIKGNIGNTLNFLMYAFTNSGFSTQEIIAELSAFMDGKLEPNVENEKNNI